MKLRFTQKKSRTTLVRDEGEEAKYENSDEAEGGVDDEYEYEGENKFVAKFKEDEGFVWGIFFHGKRSLRASVKAKAARIGMRWEMVAELACCCATLMASQTVS